MSTLMNCLLDRNTVIFFDVDGVLAPYEFGVNKHCIDDDEWDRKMAAGEDMYSTVSPIKLLQKFIERKGVDNVFVCSKASPEEWDSKLKFCYDGYGIPEDHIFRTSSKPEKVQVLKDFAKKYNIPENKIAIVEDTVDTLNMIYKDTDCATVHVSSFLDYDDEVIYG